jgi:phosphoglycerol transferase MdoB-like AlkP superfamily enzyme
MREYKILQRQLSKIKHRVTDIKQEDIYSVLIPCSKRQIFVHGFLVSLLFVMCGSSLSGIGFGFRGTQLLSELPLIFSLYCFLSAIQKARPRRVCISLFPVVLWYTCHDLFRANFARLPDLEEIYLLKDLFEFLPVWVNTLVALGVAVYVMVFVTNLRRPRGYGLAGSLVLVSFILGVMYFPATLSKTITGNLHWAYGSQRNNARYWGRSFTAVIRLAQHRGARQALDLTLPETALSRHSDTLLRKTLSPRNVYVVVMESFFDPKRLTNVTFSEDPFGRKGRAMFGDGTNALHTPGIASGTARTEFEFLCGLPAHGRILHIEWEIFSGATTYCLPEILRRQGYLTIAHHPFRAAFYNRINAHIGLGFRASFFDNMGLGKGKKMLTPHEGFLFDADLFEQVIANVRSLNQQNKPVLSYVLGMYGHYPYNSDFDDGRSYDVRANGDLEVELIIRQHYRRTKALTDYIETIEKMDSRALIIAFGDHLPPLPPSPSRYAKHGYRPVHAGIPLRETPLLVRKDGKTLQVGVKRPCELHSLVLDVLSEGAYCKQFRCACGQPGRDMSADEAKDYEIILSLAARKG